ncbi:MAG: hypothetical protein UZ05_CHB002002157 [Chlorobi bacterium OLB5]|nr:MAG: hypothetical protein UZ05_CHB002002157 [Chlorobi bacterium OLB5]
MQTNTLKKRKRRARTGFYSEVTRDNAFALSMDSHQPQKLRVYALLIQHNALTRHEISAKLNIPLHTVCARVKSLMDDELIIDLNKTVHNSETDKPNNLVKAVVKSKTLFD